jgi:septum formation protein
MKKIILASASKQRRKIMSLLGLPYVVVPSAAAEIMQITSTVSQLVKDNALIKAKEVASRYRSGLVIGADTVVYSAKKRLILKPKDLDEAVGHLRELMQQPHWVYTGVAIIDAASKRQLVDYDKTKVFMRPLNRQQITRYHQKVSPLDKAGGFDIEGKGGMFIPRIEGCFYNVVGLPLAKMTLMLEQFGVCVL